MKLSFSSLTQAELERNLWAVEAELESTTDVLRRLWLLEARRRYRQLLARLR